MSTGSLPWDILVLIFSLRTCPFSWTCLQNRSGYWRRERQGQCSVIMWVKRAAAKLDVTSTSRREEGERLARGETALTQRKLCAQDWQLQQPMDDHKDVKLPGCFSFFKILTTQNMEVTIFFVRPDFLWSVSLLVKTSLNTDYTTTVTTLQI